MRGLSPSFSGLSDDDLKRKVRYTTISRPAAIEQELGYALPHVFNHQTHHRGQVHALLTKITGDAPSLDLIMYQRGYSGLLVPHDAYSSRSHIA